MDHLSHNRRAWDRASTSGCVWSEPVDAATIARARAGDWQVVLTPKLQVPRNWFGDLRNRDVLCLASGGGQQAPILAAAGARVVSFDLSDEQLAKDHQVAEREGLALQCLQGDMADLSTLRDASFDLVFHPASNVFVPDIEPVWRECHRVLRPGGELLAGFMNPMVFLFDHDAADASGELVVKYSLPYADVSQLTAAQLQNKVQRGDMLEYGHSLDAQIGGQLSAGFVIAGFYEDRWFDDSWRLANHAPVAMATRARR
ncbi:class I SAM-dependent methyltransferase [Roseateles sp.]|uniref:class I SAM-dependent methyltransferase n=1 Tax=Roseateles sp. TaxID=1971397 RepID=UPI0039ED94F4